MKKFYFITAIVAAFLLGSCNDKAKNDVRPSTHDEPAEEVNFTVDFNSIDIDTVYNYKGGDNMVLSKMAPLGNNKAIYSIVPPGSSVGYHTHETDMEIIYVLQGTATVRMDSTIIIYTPGMVHYCPKGRSHSISNLGEENLVSFNVIAVQ
ncbi:MAG: cupin domain-containing protein [Paludibacteraceae bacterium]|nr:cupin domain-containing protein [Paludibacteraceae bacterium]